MNKKVLIIIVVAVVVIGGGLGAFILLSGGDDASSGEPVYSAFPVGDQIVTNTADGTKALVKTIVVLELQNAPDVTDDFGERIFVIRDTVVHALRSRSLTELVDVNKEGALKDEIVQRLNEELGVDFITDVYFSDFVATS